MAKAKKSETGSTPKATKPAAKKTKPAAQATAAPQIDTSLAASSAAKLIAAKAAGFGGTSSGAAKESAAFKNLKSQLANPAASGASAMANLLDKAGSPTLPKTHHVPFGAPSQVGKNQTFGADVNRTGVPRRTGGG